MLYLPPVVRTVKCNAHTCCCYPIGAGRFKAWIPPRAGVPRPQDPALGPPGRRLAPPGAGARAKWQVFNLGRDPGLGDVHRRVVLALRAFFAMLVA
eukprot:6243436-Alexandrium_andersonii.AAC.1